MSQLSTLSAPAADAAAPLLNPKPRAHFVNDHKMVIRRARQMNRTWKVIIIVMSVEYISSTFTSSHTYLFLLHPRLPIYRICGEANLNNLIQLYSHAQSCFCRRTLLSSHTVDGRAGSGMVLHAGYDHPHHGRRIPSENEGRKE